MRIAGMVALAAGVLAAVGVGVWNAVELRNLREQLAAKPTEPTVIERAKNLPDMDVPKELTLTTHPPCTVAPPDILLIEVTTEEKLAHQIRGEHLIRPDGTVGLGTYGSVYVAGMTLPQVRQHLTDHLSKFTKRPKVSADVAAFNSKWFYIISDFAGSGENVVRLPATGNETVLDAIRQIGGSNHDSERKVWVSRNGPGEVEQILPVDWKGITERGHTRTNYQLLPGDRVFVKKAG